MKQFLFLLQNAKKGQSANWVKGMKLKWYKQSRKTTGQTPNKLSIQFGRTMAHIIETFFPIYEKDINLCVVQL